MRERALDCGGGGQSGQGHSLRRALNTHRLEEQAPGEGGHRSSAQADRADPLQGRPRWLLRGAWWGPDSLAAEGAVLVAGMPMSLLQSVWAQTRVGSLHSTRSWDPGSSLKTELTGFADGWD